jgi:type II secretory pathway predicted ATPase ExeA/phage tail protein X
MLLSYYGFRESPFGVTPDPRYLYASETHREALAALLYGISSGLGFMALTAIPGMGKTTLLFQVLNSIRQNTVSAFLFQPVSTPIELLRALLAELGASNTSGDLVELQRQLNEILVKHYESGKRLVVVIDEAQNLNDDVLEQVRMLSNFETSREKLMQIILAGQPQLAQRLSSPELLQLRQRISIVARLDPLSPDETAAYISHRLTVAGYSEDSALFNSSAVAMIARHSEGIPRNINNLCFNALTIGCALKQKTIGTDVIREVIADLDLKPLAAATKSIPRPVPESSPEVEKTAWRAWLLMGVPVLCALILVLGFVYIRSQRTNRGNLDSELPAKTASQSIVNANAADPVTPETGEISKVAGPVAASGTSEAPAKIKPARLIRVRRGQNLRIICIKTFGECDSEVFRAFLEANPGISDPDHIVPGQKIFLPPSPAFSSSEAK